MRSHRRWTLTLWFVFIATSTTVVNAQTGPSTAEAAPVVLATYPQIVRIRSLEGDVRVARGNADSDAEWEQAEADLPLETGYNLVTGVGRAEIELEDGSTVYLGENSALTMDDLHTTGGVPHTEMNLLTGTVTLYLRTAYVGEMFMLKTPTDRIKTIYPGRRYQRIDSYLDAIAMTPLTQAGQKTTTGETIFHNNGKPVDAPEGIGDAKAFAAWDAWVADRVAVRNAELAAVTADSGLPSSVPGLADMQGQGVFFKCAPFGMCWEPPQDAQQPAQTETVSTGPDFEVVPSPAAATIHADGKARTKLVAVGLSGFTFPVDVTAKLPGGFSCVGVCAGQIAPGQVLPMQFQAARSVAPGAYEVPLVATSGPLTHEFVFTIYVVNDEAEALPFEPVAVPDFPCSPGGMVPHGPWVGRRPGLRVGYVRYGWAVCHTGSWIFRNHIYVWVVPTGREMHRHHHPPVRWVKCGKKIVWVPRHPRDEKGKPPVNCKHDVFEVRGKGRDVERTKLDGKTPIEVMDGPPEQFRRPPPVHLSHADAPAIRPRELRTLSDMHLQLDHGTRRFVLAQEVGEGHHRETVTQTFEEHRRSQPAGGGGATHAGGTISHGTPGSTHTGAGSVHAGGTVHPTGNGSHPGGGATHSSGGSHTSSAPSHSSPSHSAPTHTSSAPSHTSSSTTHSSPPPTHHK